MTIDLSFNKVAATYRLPSSTLHRQSELEKALVSVIRHRLAPALEQAEISSSSVICIRQIDVQVGFDPDLGLDALERHWTQLIVASVTDSIQESDGNVRIYRSVGAARSAALDGAINGELSSLWAWQQAGVVSPTAVSKFDVVAEVLMVEPQAIVPVLNDQYRSHPSAAVEFVRTMGLNRAVEVARGLLQYHNALVTFDQLVNALAAIRAGHSTPTTDATNSVSDHGNTSETGVAHALIMVAVALASDPLCLGLGSAPQIAARIGSIVGGPLTFDAHNTEIEPDRTVGEDPVENGMVDHETTDPNGDDAQPNLLSDASIEDETRSSSSRRPGEETPNDVEQATAADTDNQAGQSTSREGDQAETAESKPLVSEVAGLLFLLPIMASLDLVPALVADPVVASRPLRTILQQLGVALTGVDANDPAILAFAGLNQTNLTDGHDQEPLDIGLINTIHDAAGELADLLPALLGRDDPPAIVLAQLVGRRGWFDFSPGWVEVEYEAEGVDVDVRRAGLDLDPGFVSWTGTVVRFRYV